MEQGRADEGRGSQALRNGSHRNKKGKMQIKIFTVPLFGGEEATEEMNKFLRGNKVVDITKSMVHQGDVAYWAFCVTYLLGAPPKVQAPQPERKEKVDYRNVLDGPTFARFAVLRSIRKRLAEADAVPAFAVFTDAELAELAKLEELTPKQMLSLSGIGEKRVEKYGEPLCQLYAEQVAANEGKEN